MRAKILFLFFLAFGAVGASGQPSGFTYQGRLTDMSTPANGTYQMQFALYASATEGGPGIATVTNNAVSVGGGIFTVGLDFGSVEFTNSVSRWLEIRVKRSTEPPEAPFIILTPRQEITSAPYSLHAAAANEADSLTSDCDECVSDPHIASVSALKLVGTISDSQVADNLTVNGGTINNTVIGSTTPTFAAFTSITANAFLTLSDSPGTDTIIGEEALQRNSSSVETFSFRNAGAGTLRLLTDNTASPAVPSYSFTTDPDTGMYSSSANVLNFSAGGVAQMQIDSSGVKTNGFGYSFLSDPDTGISSFAPDTLNFSTGGVSQMVVSNGAIKASNFGSAAVPSFGFASNTGLGVYRDTTHTLGISTEGVARMLITSGTTTIHNRLKVLTSPLEVGGDTGFSLVRPNNTSGAGTVFTINGQDAAAGNNAGGSIIMDGGSATGTGTGGDVIVNGGNSASGTDGRVILGNFATSEVQVGTATTGSVTISAGGDVTIGSSSTDAINTSRAISGAVARHRTETTDFTPNVANITVLQLAFPATTTRITDLTGGVEGQCVSVIASPNSEAPYVQIQRGVLFRMSADWVATPMASLMLCRIGGLWIEVSRSTNGS